MRKPPPMKHYQKSFPPKRVGRPEPSPSSYILNESEILRLDLFLEARDGPWWRRKLFLV